MTAMPKPPRGFSHRGNIKGNVGEADIYYRKSDRKAVIYFNFWDGSRPQTIWQDQLDMDRLKVYDNNIFTAVRRCLTMSELRYRRTSASFETLHQAAKTGDYPRRTTTFDLAFAKNQQGRSALHTAAEYNHLPPGTTPQQLANSTDNQGYSALHTAAAYGYLPESTTATLLQKTRDQHGNSAWTELRDHLEEKPTHILRLPPKVFTKHHALAIKTTNQAIQITPALANKAALWLGKVLAA